MTTAPPYQVNTRAITHRRRMSDILTFDKVLKDVRALVLAEEENSLNQLGNWTLGQTLGHLAAWIQFAYDGDPSPRPNVISRTIARLLRRRILSRPLRAGVQLPGVAGGTYATDPLPTSIGLANLETAIARLEREAPRLANPLLGPLTHDEYKSLHLAHARLHLSFLIELSPSICIYTDRGNTIRLDARAVKRSKLDLKSSLKT